jgi:hypothetical protein
MPRQGEFAGEFVAGEPAGFDLAAGRQYAEGDREVEAARILRQVGRRQVDRDALVGREVEAGVLDRAADPLARLLDLDVGQSDQRETRQSVRQMHLDRDFGRFEAQQGAALHQTQTHVAPFHQDGACHLLFLIVTKCVGDSTLPPREDALWHAPCFEKDSYPLFQNTRSPLDDAP